MTASRNSSRISVAWRRLAAKTSPRSRHATDVVDPAQRRNQSTPTIFGALIPAMLLVVSGAGCAPRRTITTGVSDVSPPMLVAPLPEASRRKVAIARFSNETVYGSGLFTDKDGDRLGKQASDILAKRLVETQHFTVLERLDLDKLKTESRLMGLSEDTFRKSLIDVDALILGSVVELGRETTGSTWLVGKSKVQRARARVVLRLVDPRSGTVFYTAEGTGDATIEATATLGFGGQAGFDSTLEGKAIDAAIVNMLGNVVTTLDGRASQ